MRPPGKLCVAVVVPNATGGDVNVSPDSSTIALVLTSGSALPAPCPPGTYGNATGLTTAACSAACFPDVTDPSVCAPAACEEGYYCPEGSTHGRQHECGEGHYCPPGSAAPLAVAAGLYGVGGGSSATRTGQAACPTCCPEGVPECSAPREELYETFY